jgi:hypothetical protein
MVIFVLIIIPFSYENQNQAKPRELNIFNQIILSFRSITRLTSENEYEDYNSQKSYEFSKNGTFA